MTPIANGIKSKLIMAGIIICMVAIAVIGINIYNEWQEENAREEQYDSLKSLVTISEVETKNEDNEDNELAAQANAGISVREEYEVIDLPIQVDFASIPERGSERGQDVVAWIYSENTPIDYPVMQGDDNDYYLDHLYNGQYHKGGSIFMDYRNDARLTDKNTVLYGHHLRSGRMFASLENYKKQEYYNEHPVMFYLSEYGDYKIEIFAGAVVSGDNGVPRSFESDDEFAGYIADLKNRSTFTSNVDIKKEDKIITLSTCTYDFQNARYMVIGKLVKVVNSDD